MPIHDWKIEVMPTVLPSDRIYSVLACLRREATYEAVAAQFGVSTDDVRRWEADFIAGGSAALAESRNAPTEKDGLLDTVIQSMLAIFDLRELIDAALGLLHDVFGYIPAIWLLDGAYVASRRGYKLDGSLLPWDDKRQPLAEEQNVAAWVGIHGSPLHVPDTMGDPRCRHGVGIEEAHSELAVPLWSKGAVLGVIDVKSGKAHHFGDGDIHCLERLALYLAIAVKNARTFEALRHRIAQLDLVQSITATAIEDLAVQTVLSFTAQATLGVLGYAAVGIGLIDEGSQRLALTTVVRPADQGTVRPAVQRSEQPLDRSSLLGAAALDNRLIHIADLAQANTPVLLAPLSQSMLAVPIRHKGRAIGAIGVESQRKNPFDDTDVATITLLADQLTIAIRGAGLFEQTQAQLREISLFRRLADEAIIGIITRDIDGIIDYSNPAAAALFRFSDPAAMRRLSMRALYPDDTWYDIDKQLCLRAMRNGGWNGEVTQQRQDGQAIVVDMSVFPIYAPDGTFMTYGTILRDVTERHHLLDTIQRSNARFEAILEASEDGIIVWDEAWHVLMVNTAASRLLDTAPEDLIGHTRSELVESLPMIAVILKADERDRIEFPGDMRRVGRCRHLRWHSDRASGHLTMIYDVTSQVELEQSREDLTSMLIHDLLGPLTGIVGGIEIVRSMINDGETQERVLHFLDIAYRNGNLLLDTASSLLDITQLETGRMNLVYTPLDVAALLEEVVGMFSSSAQTAGITVSLSCSGDLPILCVDNRMVRRALANLLDNALKFTPSGGKVTLSAAREGDNMIRLGVIDTGPGIPEAYRRRVFDKYVQVPDQEGRRQGKGLGLVFCRLVAEAHQGKVWVEPRPGGGSIFSLTIAGNSAAADCA